MPNGAALGVKPCPGPALALPPGHVLHRPRTHLAQLQPEPGSCSLWCHAAPMPCCSCTPVRARPSPCPCLSVLHLPLPVKPALPPHPPLPRCPPPEQAFLFGAAYLVSQARDLWEGGVELCRSVDVALLGGRLSGGGKAEEEGEGDARCGLCFAAGVEGVEVGRGQCGSGWGSSIWACIWLGLEPCSHSLALRWGWRRGHCCSLGPGWPTSTLTLRPARGACAGTCCAWRDGARPASCRSCGGACRVPFSRG